MKFAKHGTTYQRPDEVFALEREYLVPLSEYSFKATDDYSIDYPVRKDNLVLYQGNRYRVPVDTYHQGVRVYIVIDEEAGKVSITDTVTGEIYATHPVCHEKGKIIGHSQRSERDKSKTVIEHLYSIIYSYQSITSKNSSILLTFRPSMSS